MMEAQQRLWNSNRAGVTQQPFPHLFHFPSFPPLLPSCVPLAGNFLRHENTVALRTLAYAITFWSKGNMEGLFLKHEGYCGSIGAFLSTLQEAEDWDTSDDDEEA